MMILKLLSKERTKELEELTIPIENLTGYQKPYMSYLFRIQQWYRENGLSTENTQRDMVSLLSHLLGYKPLYHKTYEYRNAVWGFEWDGEEFVLYKSKRGTSIQVHPKFRKDKLEPFLNDFMHLVKAEKAMDPYQ